MDNKKLKVIVFTQDDRFFIPTNIIKASEVCDIVEVVNNQSKNSFDNKMIDLLRWFGIWQCAKMGVVEVIKIIEGAIDAVSGYRVFGGTRSIKHAAKKLGAAYRVEKNVNSQAYVQHVKDINPDLIISYSAPQVVKPELLSVPRHSVINVHGAILPEYRGLLPSFWYIFHNEKVGGATVHKMSAAIDDGDIIVQGTVDISDCKSMFELMKRTKRLGGDLMVEAIQRIASDSVETKLNNLDEGSYFSWPTVEQAKQFRREGKKLI